MRRKGTGTFFYRSDPSIKAIGSFYYLQQYLREQSQTVVD